MISLPIDAALPALRQALQTRDEAVLEAPPGAGKTTRVPLALLHEPWLAGQTILMLARIEVVTEGILTRRLQADPALEGVGLLIFDEYHVLPQSPETHISCQTKI
ncbi:MAG: ATP-dependent helicase [Pseudomonas sp.]|nr:ATP-dependent helicase [Pseudomonas sp.]